MNNQIFLIINILINWTLLFVHYLSFFIADLTQINRGFLAVECVYSTFATHILILVIA